MGPRAGVPGPDLQKKKLFVHVPVVFLMSGSEGNKSLWFNYPVWVTLSGRPQEAAQGLGTAQSVQSLPHKHKALSIDTPIPPPPQHQKSQVWGQAPRLSTVER